MKKGVKTEGGGNLFDINLSHRYLVFRRTKIVATIGPASSSRAVLEKLIKAGLNVARINFSHGRREDHAATIKRVRTVSSELGLPVAVLGDLCGPKIRVGTFKAGSTLLKENSTVTITTKQVVGETPLIPSGYKRLALDVSVGDRILLDDGNLELRVTGKKGGQVEARVVVGGVLKDKKGMNLPDSKLKVAALTTKDREDLDACIAAGVDYVALSFVRYPSDIRTLRQILDKRKSDIGIIAKIEKPEALENISDIIDLSDGIMIARGDLGVELPAKKVPLIQNKLIELANQRNKPVIVATQMLESMIEHARPTRAEVADVAGACLSGADAVMLSGETASGKYPVEALSTMDSVLRETEAQLFFSRKGVFSDMPVGNNNTFQNALGTSIAQLSRDLGVRAIFVPSNTGGTAGVISSERPAAPIIALTPSLRVRGRLQLYWGVYTHITRRELDFEGYITHAEGIVKRLRIAKKGNFILMLARIGPPEADTKSIMIHRVS